MSLFSPTRYVASVDRIDLEELFVQGKRAILLDRDNTLVPRDRATAPDEVAAWLDRAKALGFRLCMVSNNWHRDQVMSRGDKPCHEARPLRAQCRAQANRSLEG